MTWRSAWQGSPRGPIPSAWNVSAYPSVFVLDIEGRVRFRDVRGEKLDAAVAQLLAEAAAKEAEDRTER